MRFMAYVFIAIFFIFTYLIFKPLFYIGLALTCFYIIYRILRRIDRRRAPEGKRIKHDMLKGHLMEKYGKRGGKQAYKDTVRELRRHGYR